MKKSKSRLMAAVLALLVALATSWPCKVSRAADDLTAKENKIKQSKQQALRNLQLAKQRVSSQTKSFESLKKEVEELKEKGKATEGEVEYLQGTFDKALQELTQAQEVYEKAVSEMERQQKLYEERLVAIFETRNDNSWINILISSKNLESLHTRYELSQIIADNDKQALDSLEASMEYAKRNQDNAKNVQDQADKLLKNAKKQLENLRNDISLQEENLLEQQNKLAQAQGSIKSLEAANASFDAQLKQIGQQRRAQAEALLKMQQQAFAKNQVNSGNFRNAPTPPQGSVIGGAAPAVGGGGWVFPNTYSHTITCPFGYGDNVLGNSSFHRGVDFQGAFGSKIVAARSGTVVKAYNPFEGQNYSGGSYGNYVVIDHGGGLCTLYGHMKSVLVSAGQQVQAGQVIGLCGSTGNSTGPHLHFEVQVNGELQNPLGYVS